MTDWKKIAEDKTELRAAWEGLEIPFPYPQQQIPLWLLDYGKDMILSGFKTLVKNQYKLSNPEAYLAKILRNAKRDGMTPEQRTEEISHMRSMVGKVGARKKHEKEISSIKEDFAKVCQDLPERD